MSDLIDALLELSRISRTAARPAQGRSDRGRDRGRSTSFAAAMSRARLGATIAPDLIVEADGRLVRILLDNLIGNAWKFTANVAAPRGRGSASELREDERVFFVRDNGAGFDMQLRRSPVHAVSAAPQRPRVRRHRHRARDRAANRRASRRADLGRERTRQGRDILLHATRVIPWSGVG